MDLTADGTLTGVGVSPGRGAGPVVRMPPPMLPPSAAVGLDDVDRASARIADAAEQVRSQLEAAARAAEPPAREVLEATAMMAADPTLVAAAQDVVRDGVGPARAVWEAAARVIDDLTALGGTMADRSRDIADVRDRLVAVLTGRPMPGVPDPGHPFVLVATDMSPADVAALSGHVRAIVTSRGGPVSHTAILARALGIPAVMGVRGAWRLRTGSLVVVDGAAGTVTRAGRGEVNAAPAVGGRTFDGTGRTADGHRVPLLANVGAPEEVAAAVAAGAEGVGLLRTEFCFLGRTVPGVEEQARAYRPVFEAFGGRTVVVRTLDLGDSPGALRHGPNPALGRRGLRAFAEDPQVLDDQLRAIALAAAGTDADVWVMAPMVATVAETEDFVARCARHGLTTAGVTIEVPAAALRAGPILARAAFASIGTNDLTQYVMAADRGAAELGHLCTPWQPAVLELAAAACRGGAQQNRPVGVCGEAAADPALAAVLVGLGVTSLSMSPSALADVAALLSRVTRADCVHLAAVALTADDAETARAAVRAALPVLAELGL